MLLHFQGKHAQAEQSYQRAIEILGKALGTGHPNVVAIATNYSDLLRLMGRDDEAEQLKNKALVTSDLTHSGQFQVAQSTNAEATNSTESTSETTLPQTEASAPQLGQQAAPQTNVVPSGGGAGQPSPAVNHSAPSGPFDGETHHGASPDEKWDDARGHAEAALEAQDWQKAEFFWQAAVRAAEAFPIRDPRLCKSLESLAEVYWKQAKYNQAEPLSRRVLGIYEVVLGKNHPDVGFVANNLGMLYHAQGNLQTAAILYERSLPLLVSKLGLQHPSVFNLETNLKNVLIALGRNEEAEAVKEKLTDAQQKRWTRSGKFEAMSGDAGRMATQT